MASGPQKPSSPQIGDGPKDTREQAIVRQTDPGIFSIGEEVIHDGEAAAKGYKPMTKIPFAPESDD